MFKDTLSEKVHLQLLNVIKTQRTYLLRVRLFTSVTEVSSVFAVSGYPACVLVFNSNALEIKIHSGAMCAEKI